MARILVADDSIEIRSALRLVLETRLDLEWINEARDMEHVLAQVEDSKPSCIILDWNLPGRPIRGRILILKALVPTIKIIVSAEGVIELTGSHLKGNITMEIK